MSQVLHLAGMKSVKQKLMLLRGVLSGGNYQFSLISRNLTHCSRAEREMVIAMIP